MKYLKLFENMVFNNTIYRIPTIKELSKFNNTKLTPKEIFNEIQYTIIGRSIINDINKRKILETAELLNSSFTDVRYLEVLKIAKEFQKYKRLKKPNE